MKVVDNSTCSNFFSYSENQNSYRFSVPKNQPLADTFVKKNALSQVSFGENVSKRVLEELISNKAPHQIHLKYPQLEKFLTVFLGFIDEGYKGSHHKFNKQGLVRPLEIPEHGKEARPEVIKAVRKILKENMPS